MFGLVPFGQRDTGLTTRKNGFGIDGFLDDFFNDSFFSFKVPSNPIRADVRETDKEFIIDAEIPGVKKEDINIELKNDVLSLSVEQKDEVKEEGENYLRRERKFGSYCRNFYVEDVSQDKISAKYDNGVLTVKLPKKTEKKKTPKKIDIN